jgi:hypothetical protein
MSYSKIDENRFALPDGNLFSWELTMIQGYGTIGSTLAIIDS